MTDFSALLDRSGAILRGHFLLTSGRHSDVYFEKFRILEQPAVLSKLCEDLAIKLRKFEPDFIAGPTTGGIIIAFEVARQLGLPAVYVESEGGQKRLRRGKRLEAGMRGVVVDDVLTTGQSLIETKAALQEAGGEVVALGVLIDRSAEGFNSGLPLFATYRVEAATYAPDEVPEWLAAIPLEKPGTRHLP